VPLSDPGARWDFIILRQRGKASDATRAFMEALKETAQKAAGKKD
jgi:hypothetical protein